MVILLYCNIIYKSFLFYICSLKNIFFEIKNENDIQNCFADQERELNRHTYQITNKELELCGNVKIAYKKFKLSSINVLDLEADEGLAEEEEEEEEEEEAFNDQHNHKSDTQVGSPQKHEFGTINTSKGLGNSVTFFDITQFPQNQPWVRSAGKQ